MFVNNVFISVFSEKNGKALHISYKDKVKLVAYTKQVSHGKYRPDITPEVGLLDVVGNDRRYSNRMSHVDSYSSLLFAK